MIKFFFKIKFLLKVFNLKTDYAPYFFILSSICSINLAYAQNKDVKGSVKSSDGTPLQGATVLVKGTTAGTSTNNTGVFSLNMNPTNATLVISHKGYETKEYSSMLLPRTWILL